MSSKQSVDINLNITVDGNTGSASVQGTGKKNSKIETDLTVSELAAICRIFYDLGFFTNLINLRFSRLFHNTLPHQIHQTSLSKALRPNSTQLIRLLGIQ